MQENDFGSLLRIFYYWLECGKTLYYYVKYYVRFFCNVQNFVFPTKWKRGGSFDLLF